MKNFLSYKFLIPLSLLLGMAPFVPQPHLVEKIGMLLAGELQRPLDIFDLLWHSWPLALLGYRISLDLWRRTGQP